MEYDPIEGPAADAWLEADESERIDAVRHYHEGAGVSAGSLRGHAIVHSMVETQLARGMSSVAAAAQRLRDEGLDRHEAVHAIGSVLSKLLYEAASGDGGFDGDTYDKALRSLTAANWRETASSN